MANVDNDSSCMVSHQFQWSNDAGSNQWTTPMQYYKLKNPYYPGGGSIAEGHYVVETKNKVRGSGKVLSIKFATEPGKHCVIYGWSVTFGVNGNV